VCQSAFYIICFRGADAVRFSQEVQKNVASGARARELEHIDLRPARWTRICAHPLDPLRYCLESVRSEFSRLSRSFGLIDPQVLDKILADGTHHFSGHQLRKKQAVSRITTAATLEKERLNGGVGGLGRGTNPLDSFFPFDPYLLRRSHVFVEPFYNHWTGGDRPEDAEDGSVDDEESATFVPTDDENSEDDVSSDNDDDDDEEEEEDHDGQQRMSYSPNAASISSRSITPQRSRADVVVNKETLTEVWSSALKRARAASIENGSW
jgi:RNA polymerase I-specific transcription initiation factor RRN3